MLSTYVANGVVVRRKTRASGECFDSTARLDWAMLSSDDKRTTDFARQASVLTFLYKLLTTNS